MKKSLYAAIALPAMFASAANTYANVQVDVNQNMKHEVRGVSDFNRKKHITVHANLTEGDWNGEAETMNYLMNDLDVYFGRDNGMASWIFRATAQDPVDLGTAHIEDLVNFGLWHKENMYDILPESLRAYESRSDEMIMGITPHGPYPTQSYWADNLAGAEDDAGKYVTRHLNDAAEWVGEYLDQFFRKPGETSGTLMPKYWEVINEPDMDINVGHTFVLSSFEQVFEYHNLVAEQIKAKLPVNERPLVGGMTWGLHDLDSPDLSIRANSQEKAIRMRYALPTDAEGQALENFLWDVSDSTHWDVRTNDFYQWDYLWKGFMDAAGHNMDFYSIHLYDWVPMVDDQRTGGKFRTGMTTEAILEMVEWYDAQVNGADNRKPWVISEYGAIATGHANVPFLENDYRYADWLHVRTFNQMFMQLLTRPDMIEKSMPFAPIKAKWGAYPYEGDVVRYEPALMHSEAGPDTFFTDESDWFVTDKIQWYELWSDVKGTRVDTHSSDPDVQVDAYVDGNHTYLILNNLEWYNIPVDLALAGINGNAVKSVSMKHSYLAEGLSPINVGRGVLAHAELTSIPETVTLQPGSTIILDIEYNQNVTINQTNDEIKYFAESLSGAGKGQAAIGKIHRVTASSMTAQVNGVNVPSNGEATLRIAAKMYPFHASNARADLNIITINGHKLDIRKEVNKNGQGIDVEHLDFMGPEIDLSGTSLNLIEIPVPLEYLQTNNTVTADINLAEAFTAVTIKVWDMSTATTRTAENNCNPCTSATSVAISGVNQVNIKESIALSSTLSPASADNKSAVWTTSNVNVASVDQNGLVTGTGVGTAVITATTADGSSNDTHQISVVTIQPNSVELDIASANLGVNDTLLVNASIEPFNATNKNLEWTSNNTNIATVSQSGMITAVNAGSTTITARATDGGASDNVAVTVSIIIPTDLNIVSDAAIVLPGTYQVNAEFTPSNTTNQTINWQSSNTSVATVSNTGLITGVSAGTANITAVSQQGGLQDVITVKVLNTADVSSTGTVVQAESFAATGGPTSGFTTGGDEIIVINNNQTGDWVDYDINFTQAGVYRVVLTNGTNQDGAGAEVLINGIASGSAAIPNTTDWDILQDTVITNNLLVESTGTNTVRLISVGADAAWQWNADKFTLILLSATDGVVPTPTPTATPDTATPTPTPTPTPDVATPTPTPEVTSPPTGEPIVVEMEGFTSTGKVGAAAAGDTFAGFNATATAINFNTSGDWADYTVNLPAGSYIVTLKAATPMTGDLGATVTVGNQSISTVISSTNGWNTYADFTFTDQLNVNSSGNVTVRVASIGGQTWQWNADSITFTPVIVATPTPTATPTVTPTPTPETTPVAGEPIVVEAENFDSTDGTHAGFQTYNVNGGAAINHNQTGDYADYTVNFPEDGEYKLEILAGTPTDNGNVSVTIDNNVVGTVIIPNSDGWDNFETTVITESVTVSAGAHTVRVESIGTANAWQWNADSFTFTPLNVTDPGNGGEPAQDIVVEAESFTTQSGMATLTWWGTTTFLSNNQTGDWAEYEVNFPVGGNFNVEFIASTNAVTGANATIYVDGVEVSEGAVTGTNWNTFTAQQVASNIAISAGTHTIKIESTGPNNIWQWYLDKMTFQPVN